MKSLEIIIGTTGEVKIDAIGFTGNACEKATAEMQKALGDKTKETNKPERYAHTGAAQQKANQ